MTSARVSKKHALNLALVALLYLAGAKAGFALAFEIKNVTAVWPPTGIALAALVVLGRSVWPAIFVAAFISNILTDVPVLTAAGIAIGNTMGPVAAAFLLSERFRLRPELDRARDLFNLALFGGVLCMCITATNGVCNLAIAGLIDWEAFWSTWRLWWLGDAMGVLLVGPLLLTAATHKSEVWPPVRTLEFVACVGAVILVGHASFTTAIPLAYPTFPVAVWMAMRFDQKHTALAVNLIAAIAIWHTAQGHGPFQGGSIDRQLGMLVTFMAVLSLTSLALGALVAERKEALRQLHTINVDLEQLVAKRTDALRESEERFRGAFESAAHGIALVSTEGRWLQVNKALCEMVGYKEQELLATNFQALTHPDDMQLDLQHVGELLSGVITSYQMEKRYFHKCGEIVWVLLSVSLVRDADRRPLHFVSQIIDITKRNEAKQALIEAREAAEAANRTKNQFLANMSHELRTPMNGVVGCADVLLDTNMNDDQRLWTTRLRDAATSLLAIIDDVLDLSKIEAGKLHIENAAFSPAQLAATTVEFFQMQARSRGLSLSLYVDPSIPGAMLADARRVRQILSNLLANAIKYTTTGSVEVHVYARHASLFVEVRDTGIGIPDAERHLLFQSFTRLSRSNTVDVGGTGLGLAIAKNLAEAMGGSIGAQPRLAGGSMFWFKLPIIEPVQTTVENNKTAIVGALRVLVAEDLELNQFIIRAALESLGHFAVIVANGEEVLDQLRNASFDAIIMDIQMPIMDGIEAAVRIRASSSAFSEIPIIALTATAMLDEVLRCKTAGINAHLAKPIDRYALASTLCDLTSRARYNNNPKCVAVA